MLLTTDLIGPIFTLSTTNRGLNRMRTRERDGEEFHRVSVDLPANMVKDVDVFAEQDDRKRADWIRIALGAYVRARKAKGGRK